MISIFAPNDNLLIFIHISIVIDSQILRRRWFISIFSPTEEDYKTYISIVIIHNLYLISENSV